MGHDPSSACTCKNKVGHDPFAIRTCKNLPHTCRNKIGHDPFAYRMRINKMGRVPFVACTRIDNKGRVPFLSGVGPCRVDTPKASGQSPPAPQVTRATHSLEKTTATQSASGPQTSKNQRTAIRRSARPDTARPYGARWALSTVARTWGRA